MVHATPDFAAGSDDELNGRTLPVFFQVLRDLLTAGASTIADAAWRTPI